MLDQQTSALLHAHARLISDWAAREPNAGIVESRAFAAEIFAGFAGTERDEIECDVTALVVQDGGGLRPARLYRPRDTQGLTPVIAFFHGGGWAIGDLDSYDGLLRSLCALSGASFVSVDYRLAPEHPFPAGLDDTIAATHWVAEHAYKFGADASRLAVMGDSAGGNLAAVVAQLARRGGPAIAAQYLIYPMTDISTPHSSFPSRGAYGDGNYFLTRDAIDATAMWYLSNNGAAADPRVSPLLDPDLTGLPRAMIVVAGHDPLRDEACAYADRLRAAGVDVIYRNFDTTIHGFVSFGILDAAQTARREIADSIRRTLGSGSRSTGT